MPPQRLPPFRQTSLGRPFVCRLFPLFGRPSPIPSTPSNSHPRDSAERLSVEPRSHSSHSSPRSHSSHSPWPSRSSRPLSALHCSPRVGGERGSVGPFASPAWPLSFLLAWTRLLLASGQHTYTRAVSPPHLLSRGTAAPPLPIAPPAHRAPFRILGPSTPCTALFGGARVGGAIRLPGGSVGPFASPAWPRSRSPFASPAWPRSRSSLPRSRSSLSRLAPLWPRSALPLFACSDPALVPPRPGPVVHLLSPAAGNPRPIHGDSEEGRPLYRRCCAERGSVGPFASPASPRSCPPWPGSALLLFASGQR